MGIATGLAIAGTGATLLGARSDRKQADKNMRSAERQRAESQKFIEESVNKARGDLFKLFPAAQESRNQGLQAGIDLYKQSIPQQLGAFTQGNMAAQNALIQGLPAMQAAIMGQPMNYNPQAQQVAPNAGNFLQGIQAPPFAPIQQQMPNQQMPAGGMIEG